MRFFRRRPKLLYVYCDGGVGGQGKAAGLGVVIRDEQGEVVGLVKRSMPPMTSVEAEYAALVLGLTSVKQFKPKAVQIYMDSQTVVTQMTGERRIHSQALKGWHSRACRLAHQFKEITFSHIPRDFNQLADALAGEAWAEVEKKSGE